jgi:hypothetical protein
MKGSPSVPPPDPRNEEWLRLVSPSTTQPTHYGNAPVQQRRSVPPLAPRRPVDRLAREEEAALAAGELERRARDRTERTKGFVHRGVIFSVQVIGSVFLVAFVAWAWHYVGPPSLHWIPADQLAQLDRAIPYVLSLAVGGVLGRHLEKHL